MDELHAKNPKAAAAIPVGARTSASRSNLKRAMVAAEDAKFVDHEGFDWDGIQLALEKNQKKGRVVRRRLDDHPAAREEPVPVAVAQLLAQGARRR